VLEKVDRFLFHRWVQRVAVVSFLAGIKPLEAMLGQVDTYVKALDTAATPRQSTAQS
jgi:hypothetical protein